MILKVLIKVISHLMLHCHLAQKRNEFLTQQQREREHICEHAESDISICRNMEMTEHCHTQLGRNLLISKMVSRDQQKLMEQIDKRHSLQRTQTRANYIDFNSLIKSHYFSQRANLDLIEIAGGFLHHLVKGKGN